MKTNIIKFILFFCITLIFSNAYAQKWHTNFKKQEKKDFDFFVLKDESKKSMVYNVRNVKKRENLLKFHENFQDERAIEINLSYEDKGHEMDWKRWNDSGFAQRFQIMEPYGKTTKAGKNKWYRVGVFIPQEVTSNDHTISFFDFKMIYGKGEKTVGPAFNLTNNEFTFFFNSSKYLVGGNIEGSESYLFDHYGIILDENYEGKLKDKWVNIIVNANWSKNGFLHLWIDGELRVSYFGDTLGDADRVRFKFGPYRNHMIKATNKGQTIKDIKILYSNVGKSNKCENLWNGCKYLTDQLSNISQLHGVRFANFIKLSQKNNQTKPEPSWEKIDIERADPIPSK